MLMKPIGAASVMRPKEPKVTVSAAALPSAILAATTTFLPPTPPALASTISGLFGSASAAS